MVGFGKAVTSNRSRLATLLSLLSLPLALLAISPLRSAAQVDPRGRFRTITTDHLQVHYPARLDSLARIAAVIAERSYVLLARDFKAPRGRIDMLLIDHVDDSNGFAEVFPQNRITVFAVPPVGSKELRFNNDWLSLVIAHELAHVFHIDRAGGWWRVGRFVFGRNPSFFPNSLTPSWVKEGFAVFNETRITGSGRLAGTEYANLLRTAVMDSAWPAPPKWSAASSQYPRGQGPYAYGSALMNYAAHRSVDGDPMSDSSMRKFVDGTAAFPIPFLISRASRAAFGRSFDDLYVTMRDSISASLTDSSGSLSRWRIVGPEGWYAGPPRWIGADSLAWSASTGRSVTGLFVASVSANSVPRRVARRNSIDVNVLMDSTMVFAQSEFVDSYTVRSDLHLRNWITGAESRLTHGARLVMPDARQDGTIVAVQLGANTSRLVTVRPDGKVNALRSDRSHNASDQWSDPRWSPDGTHIAAIQHLRSGEQRVVLLDSNGTALGVVASGTAVFESPSFTPDGRRLVWSSDRSGRMQVETAALLYSDRLQDNNLVGNRTDTSYGAENIIGGLTTRIGYDVHAIHDPSVSPDGRMVAALLLKSNGYHVAVTELDTAGNAVESSSPSRDMVIALTTPHVAVDSAMIVNSDSKPYQAWRQLLPRYWMPASSEARDGTVASGASSSARDILGRHEWQAAVTNQAEYRETNGFLSYRYAGLGVPVLDFGFSQEWDGSFRSLDSNGGLVGLIARRRKFITVAATLPVPRYRWNMSSTFGGQYEVRDFTSDVDAALGDGNSLLRTGTRYGSLFMSSSVSTARRALSGISIEEGLVLGQSTSYRWRSGASRTGSWRSTLTGKLFIPLSLPGYSRHAIALRAAAGITDKRTATEFSAGGVSGVSADIAPGLSVGEPSRPFPVRGFVPGFQRGIRAAGAGIEYRAPLALLGNVPPAFTMILDRLSLSIFGDAARAWCPASFATTANGKVLCVRASGDSGWLSSVGGELVLDMAANYDVPLRLRAGIALPVQSPSDFSRKAAFHFTLGGYF